MLSPLSLLHSLLHGMDLGPYDQCGVNKIHCQICKFLASCGLPAFQSDLCSLLSFHLQIRPVKEGTPAVSGFLHTVSFTICPATGKGYCLHFGGRALKDEFFSRGKGSFARDVGRSLFEM